MPDSIVIAPSTAKRYQTTALGLIKRFATLNPQHATENDAIIKSDHFINWLTNTLAPTITRSTFTLYRASLIYYSASIDLTLSDGYKLLPLKAAKRRPRASTKTVNTSSQRQRALPEQQRRQLVQSLLKNPTQTHVIATALLALGSMTGLRPTEWRTARLSELDDRRTLVVQNAKTTHGRSHGPTRTLYIDALPDWAHEAISDLLDVVSPLSPERWQDIYSRAQEEVWRHARKLYPRAARWPTIYSARHQLVLDMRAAGIAQQEIAAALGHLCPRTATRNYGRRRRNSGSGGGGPIIQASAADIANVKPYVPSAPPRKVDESNAKVTSLAALLGNNAT